MYNDDMCVWVRVCELCRLVVFGDVGYAVEVDIALCTLKLFQYSLLPFLSFIVLPMLELELKPELMYYATEFILESSIFFSFWWNFSAADEFGEVPCNVCVQCLHIFGATQSNHIGSKLDKNRKFMKRREKLFDESTGKRSRKKKRKNKIKTK